MRLNEGFSIFRIKSLKKIQLEATKIEAQFYEEVHNLECKYHTLYQPLYSKRTQITKGTKYVKIQKGFIPTVVNW